MHFLVKYSKTESYNSRKGSLEGQILSQRSITATQVGNVGFTSFVDVHVACPTFQSLVNKAVKERATVLAEGGTGVSVNRK